MKTISIKIQKNATHPKGNDMVQLLESHSGGILPTRIVFSKSANGKIEFFSEEEKRENGIGCLERGQDDARKIFEEIFDSRMEGKVHLVTYSKNGSKICFEAELSYGSCVAEQVRVDTHMFNDICSRIVKNGICTQDILDRNIQVMKEHRFPDELIRQVLLRYKRYDRPARVPKTVYIDPDKESKTSLLALCAINILIGAPLILEGDKSVGKNMCAETLAMIFNMPFDMTTMTRSMTADELYGTKSTDNSATNLMNEDMAEEYLKLIRGQNDFDMAAAAKFEYLKAKSASVAIVQEHSSFVHWLQHGGVYCLNELNMAEPNFLASFVNQITDGSGFLDIQGYGRININSDCVLIGTQNADYTGTCEQNDATMSRFACVQFDYPKSIRPMIESVVGKDRLSAEYFKQVDGFYSLLHDSVQKGTLDNSCLNIRGFCRALHAVATVPGASSLKKQVQLHVINTCPVDERNLLEQHLNMRITL